MSASIADDPIRLLHDLRSLVQLHRDFGILEYPQTPDLDRFLKSAPPPVQTKPRNKNLQLDRETTPPKNVQPKPVTITPPQPSQTLNEIETELGDCTRCTLHHNRDRLLFGAGPKKARLFIVGDFPTHEDEAAGNPFGGEAGELLTKMLKAIGLNRNDVYLSTTVKCRTADNSAPQPEQIATCLPFLTRQISAVGPLIICTMGPIATQALLKNNTPLIRLRGRFHQCYGIELMPTFHPSFLIKNPDMKKATWIDLQLIQAKLA